MQTSPVGATPPSRSSLADHHKSPRGLGSHKMQAAPCRSDAPVAISLADHHKSPRGRGSHKTNFAGPHQQCAQPKKKPCLYCKAFKFFATQGHIKPRALLASERPVHQPRVIFSTRVPPRLAGPSPAAWGLKLLAPNCLGPRANLSPAPAAPRGAGRAALRLSPPRSSQRPP